jgi:hypothetical protein
MATTQHNWSWDWANRIENRARAIGYASLSELLADVPGEPYADVAKRLGDVAPIQVLAVQLREAKLTGRVRDAAKDSLVRNLVEQLPNGWGIGDNSDWQSVRALSSWSSELAVTGGCEELKPRLLAIARALRALPPPSGWIPSSPNDSIIERVFDAEWE